jgi:hypothetical protein
MRKRHFAPLVRRVIRQGKLLVGFEPGAWRCVSPVAGGGKWGSEAGGALTGFKLWGVWQLSARTALRCYFHSISTPTTYGHYTASTFDVSPELLPLYPHHQSIPFHSPAQPPRDLNNSADQNGLSHTSVLALRYRKASTYQGWVNYFTSCLPKWAQYSYFVVLWIIPSVPPYLIVYFGIFRDAGISV